MLLFLFKIFKESKEFEDTIEYNNEKLLLLQFPRNRSLLYFHLIFGKLSKNKKRSHCKIIEPPPPPHTSTHKHTHKKKVEILENSGIPRSLQNVALDSPEADFQVLYFNFPSFVHPFLSAGQ